VARKKTTVTRSTPDYDAVLADVVVLVEAAKHASARAVNALLTATYWGIGRRIVEQEQHGAKRAGYGKSSSLGCRGTCNRVLVEGSGERTCFRCAPSFWLTARFSRLRLENW